MPHRAAQDFAAAREAAARYLWTHADGHRDPYLYVLLDGARDPAIYPALRRFAAEGAEVIPLYQGKAAADLASVAPYLMCFGTNREIFDWFVAEGWGHSWGVLIWSLVTPVVLRDQLRRHVYARREDRSLMLFRFYDPRVLRRVLPRLTPEQLTDFYGTAITRFRAEGEDCGAVESYAWASDRLRHSHRVFPGLRRPHR